MLNNKLQTILYYTENNIAYVTLNRPEIHNAFNDVMIKELSIVFDEIKRENKIRVVVLTGNGKSFCAGADLNWMRKVKDYSYEKNLKGSLELSELFHKIYTSPKPTIAKVNGVAIGGGTGLVAACDIAVASENAKFSFSEVKIGLIPACISPYVVKKCGEGKCREFFLTGERMLAEKAKKAGLINFISSLEKLDEFVDKLINQLISSGPIAISKCKELLQKVPEMNIKKAGEYTAEVIAKMRISNEGQEGMNAFLQKRKPDWNKDV
ncbi:MAG: enoyl-CoA hydratase/isomerase family protein [Candidatus Cloacimonetes bacterium]|nr:enoyl-CoA hydratase/isomerase family protein [Candidatus Cloacimonadota bacterium]